MNRWGEKSSQIEEWLLTHSIVIVGKSGKKYRFTGNFSKIARRFGVTRELVRQIAAYHKIRSVHRQSAAVKRILLKKGLTPDRQVA